MAKLPQKPVNIVHDYFPAGADGSSPHTQDTPAFFTDIESYGVDTALPKKEGKNLTTLVPEKRNNPELFGATPAWTKEDPGTTEKTDPLNKNEDADLLRKAEEEKRRKARKMKKKLQSVKFTK